MKASIVIALLAGAALSLALITPVYSQTTFASITGTVTDATGAVVPNATVTATNMATNIKWSAKSNAAGNYTIAQLNEGTYTLRAEAAGFRAYVAENVGLVARDMRRVDVKLEVGGVETAVEVSGGTTLIETETARIADNKNTLVLNTLPLNTRGMWAYLSLSPGLQQQSGSSVTRFAGSRVNENNWSIDGTTFADGVDNTATGPLANYIESFQEMKIDLSNNSAEFGSMGQVTIISKSGTNSLHGSLFDYYSTKGFRARDFFADSPTAGVRHAPGGTVGGPVWLPKIHNGRDRTFFFFSFETARGSAVTQNLNPSVPLASWRQGDFTSASAAAIRDPMNNGTPFPGKIIPAARINPVSKKIQDLFYPLPNYGDGSVFSKNNYRESKIRAYDPSTYWTTRIDHHFSSKDSVFGRYTWHRLYNRPWEDNLPTVGLRWQQRDDRAATVSYTHMFRSNLLNEIRWGYGLNNNPINFDFSKGTTQHGLQLVQTLGLVGLAPNLPDVNGIFNVRFSGNAYQQITQYRWTPLGYRTHTEDIQDHLSWFRARHNLKFGFNLLRSEFDEQNADNNLFGNAQFSNRFTGFDYADFILGIPTTVARSYPPLRVLRNRWAYDFYALDDFKLSPKLTLNLGLRYELHLNWHENNGLISTFDVGSGKIVVPDGSLSKVSPLFPQNYIPVVEAKTLGLPGSTIIRNDRNNFAPRIGVAYRPWGQNTVFRAGWGVFYNVVPFVYVLGFGGSPFTLNEPSYTNPTNNPQVILPRVFPAAGTGSPEVAPPAAENPNYRTPYSMQYNVTIEHQQWNTGFRLSYVGTAGRKFPWGYNYNSPVPNAQPYTAKARPFPNYPDIYYYTNGAGHQYNGLTVEALRHLAGGLYLQSSWTWARDRYDLDYNWDLDPWQFVAENPQNRQREVGPAQEIPTQRFAANWIYQLPFGKGRHWGNKMSRLPNLLAGGWELSGVFTAQTGQFLTPLWTGPDPVGISYTDSDPAEVTLRPDVLRNPNLSNPTIAKWYDPAAFAAPQPGSFGTSGRGVVKGPGVNVWHMGLHKDFFFTEQARLRWEMTAVNIFNHPNWGNPSLDITGGAGVISSTGGPTNGSITDNAGSRSFRMGVRLQW